MHATRRRRFINGDESGEFKRIAIISEAASGGSSRQADKRFRNQPRRTQRALARARRARRARARLELGEARELGAVDDEHAERAQQVQHDARAHGALLLRVEARAVRGGRVAPRRVLVPQAERVGRLAQLARPLGRVGEREHRAHARAAAGERR